MDTSQRVAIIPIDKETSVAGQRQRRSIAEKRRIVEETLVAGASVARVARAYGINANQVFGWRRLYVAGRLGEREPAMKLLPVRVSESSFQILLSGRRPEVCPPPAPDAGSGELHRTVSL